MRTTAPRALPQTRAVSLSRIGRAVPVCGAQCLPSAGCRRSLARTGSGQLSAQGDSGGPPPPGHQAVAADCVEAAAVPRRRWVAATGDVVECTGVTRADAEVVEEGIDEPHPALSV